MQGTASTAQRSETGPLTQADVEGLDAAARTTEVDDALLRMTPARDIRARIGAVVGLLEKMEPQRLLRKQGPIARLTGADVEARLEFELASEEVLAAMRQLRVAAQNATRLLQMLERTRSEIAGDQHRLALAIEWGQERLTTCAGTEEFILARFERRLANITAMHTANTLTIEQIGLARTVLTSLLDRFTDVETLMLPLWQRHMLALATSAGSARRKAGQDFAATNTQLIDYLSQDLKP